MRKDWTARENVDVDDTWTRVVSVTYTTEEIVRSAVMQAELLPQEPGELAVIMSGRTTGGEGVGPAGYAALSRFAGIRTRDDSNPDDELSAPATLELETVAYDGLAIWARRTDAAAAVQVRARITAILEE